MISAASTSVLGLGLGPGWRRRRRLHRHRGTGSRPQRAVDVENDAAVGRAQELDDLEVLIGAEPSLGQQRGAASGLGDGQPDLLDRLARNLQNLPDVQRLEGGEAQALAVQHRVDAHRRARRGPAHQRLPEVVRAVARGGLVADLDRGADHVERRERQDQLEAPAAPGLAEAERHPEDHDVDIVRGEAELRQVLSQVADLQPLGQRPAEVGADRVAEGGEDRVEVQAAERHVDGGERPRHRIRRLAGVAAQRQVDQMVGEVRLDGDQPGRVGVLDVDEAEHRRPGDRGGGVRELDDAGRGDLGADDRLHEHPHPVLDAAGEGLAEQLGVGERRAGDAAVAELAGEDGGGGGHGGAARGSGGPVFGGNGCRSLNAPGAAEGRSRESQ